MSVAVTTTLEFKAGVPKLLFKGPRGINSWDVSNDGKRFLSALAEGTVKAVRAATPAPYQSGPELGRNIEKSNAPSAKSIGIESFNPLCPCPPANNSVTTRSCSMIGKGGMGEVYRRHRHAPRPVRRDQGFLARVQRSFRARGTRHLRAQSSQHLHALRCRPELPGHGVRRGRDALEAHRAGPAAAR